MIFATLQIPVVAVEISDDKLNEETSETSPSVAVPAVPVVAEVKTEDSSANNQKTDSQVFIYSILTSKHKLR